MYIKITSLLVYFDLNFYEKTGLSKCNSASLHNPKSDNLICPLLSSKILSGLRSLWIKPSLWTDATAYTSSAI